VDSAVRLLPHAEHEFRMAGGHSSGDTVKFDFNDAGEITGIMLGAYPMEKASD
jgi:hypothetical protein